MPAWLPYAACAALAFAVYANSLGNGFITDDQFQIVGNPVVTGAQSLWSTFGAGVWTFLGYRGNYFRPLQMVVYGALYRVFGPTPAAFHLLMVLLHVVNTMLVYSLARRLLAATAPVAAALFAAALFAVHPIHTEAVDWIAALPDLLVTTIALAGLRAFVAEEARPGAWQSVVHCLVYFAALLTKETGAMLLPMYAAYQIYAVGVWRNARLYAGMLATLGIYLAMRVHALGGLAPAQAAFFHLRAGQFAASAVVLAAHYCAALVWPFNLNFFHVFHPASATSPAFALAVIVLGGLGWAAWFFRRREPLAVLAIIWVLAAIVPALNIAGVGQNVFAERYLYLPSVGFAILASLAWNWLARTRGSCSRPVAGVLLITLSVMSMARNLDWKDDFTLAQATLPQSSDSGYMHNVMAGLWLQRGDLQRARDEEELAVRYDPGSAVFHMNLGNIRMEADPASAIREFAAAVAIQPNLAEGYYDMGLAYRQTGDASRAAEEFRRALAVRPEYKDAADALAGAAQ